MKWLPPVVNQRLVGSVLLFGLWTTGCDVLYTFDREPPISRGAIFGEAVRDASGGDKAAYSQINMMGLGLVRQAASDGSFVLADLGAGTYVLRLNDDDDGDGQPERSRLIATTMAIANKPDAIGFGQGRELVSTSLGEVVLEGTGAVEGLIKIDDGVGNEVPPNDLGYGGRAFLYRDIALEVTGEQALQLGADAETHVDSTGAYRFNKALAGDFLLVVTLQAGAGALREETVFVSSPQRLTLAGDATVVAAPIFVDGVDPNLETLTRPVEIVVSPPISERAAPYAIFVPPGRPVSTCQATRPQVTQFAYERIVTATVATISRVEDAPQGVWDVRFCAEAHYLDPQTGEVEDDATLGTATLYSLVIPASDDGVSTILAGPVVLSRELDGCLRRVCADGAFSCDDATKTTIRDCDGDGLAGVTPYDVSDPDSVATWAACATQCGAATGLAAVEAECAFGGAIFDCDDDGDLQSDASEPPACYGPGLGDDRDGDGICSGADAYPTCSANTAEACAAGTVDVDVVISPEFGGGPGIETPFDPTFGGTGVVDVITSTLSSTTNLMGLTPTNGGDLLYIVDEQTDGDPQAVTRIHAGVIPVANPAGFDSVELFEAVRLGEVFLSLTRSKSRTVGGQIVHYIVGDGSSTNAPTSVPHLCRATSDLDGANLTADVAFQFEGCTNALDPLLPPVGEFTHATILSNGDVWALGGTVDGLFVQNYQPVANAAQPVGLGFPVDFSTLLTTTGATSAQVSDIIGLESTDDTTLFVFALIDLDGTETTVVFAVDPITGNTLSTEVVDVPSLPAGSRLIGRAVSSLQQGEVPFVTLVGSVELDDEGLDADAFAMQVRLILDGNPMVTPASLLTVAAADGVYDAPSVVIDLGTSLFAAGFTTRDADEEHPQSALWRFDVNANDVVTRHDVGAVVPGLLDTASVIFAGVQVGTDLYLGGVKRADNAQVINDDDARDTFVAKLAR